MKFKNIKGPLILIVSGIIWGTTFVAQSIGSETLGPFTFISFRTLIGAVVLLPVLFFRDKYSNTKLTEEQKAKSLKLSVSGGISCGIILFFASSLQQYGFIYGITAGKSGFITAMYVVIVPIIGIFFKKPAGFFVYIAIVLSVTGLYLLCVPDLSQGLFKSFTFSKGEIVTSVCSVFYALHIITIDYFSPQTDGIRMSFVQFLVAGLLAFICMFWFENPSIELISKTLPSLMYSGVMSCGVAYTLQIIGQKGTDPTVASILMCLESVFAVLSGWIILGDVLNTQEIIGCVLMFLAITLAQIPAKNLKKIRKTGLYSDSIFYYVRRRK